MSRRSLGLRTALRGYRADPRRCGACSFQDGERAAVFDGRTPSATNTPAARRRHTRMWQLAVAAGHAALLRLLEEQGTGFVEMEVRMDFKIRYKSGTPVHGVLANAQRCGGHAATRWFCERFAQELWEHALAVYSDAWVQLVQSTMECGCGRTDEHEETLEWLSAQALAHERDPQMRQEKGDQSWTGALRGLAAARVRQPAQHVLRLKWMRRFVNELRRRCSNHSQGVDHLWAWQSMVNHAGRGGSVQVCEFLLDQGAGVTEAFVEEAAEEGNLDVLRWFLKHSPAGVQCSPTTGGVALSRAARGGHFTVLQYLHEEAGFQVGATDTAAADGAAHQGSLVCFEYLVHHCNAQYTTASVDLAPLPVLEFLHRHDPSATGSPNALLRHAHKGHVSELEFVAAQGMSPTQPSADAWAPSVAEAHQWNALRALTTICQWSYGADPNASCDRDADRVGTQVASAAAGAGELAVLEWLMDEHGVVMDRSVVGRAATNGQLAVLELLAARGQARLPVPAAEPDFDVAHVWRNMCSRGHTPVVFWILEEMKKSSSSLSSLATSIREGLCIAAQHGHPELVRVLLQACSDDDSETAWTALCAACEGGFVSCVEALLQSSQLQQLPQDQELSAFTREANPVESAAKRGRAYCVGWLERHQTDYALLATVFADRAAIQAAAVSAATNGNDPELVASLRRTARKGASCVVS